MNAANMCMVGFAPVLLAVITASAQMPTSERVASRPAFIPGGGGAEFSGLRAEAAAMESVKKQIRASHEEWKVIGPKLRKVIAARRTAEAGLNAGDGLGESGPIVFGPPRDRGPGRGGAPGRPGFGGDSFSGPGSGRFGPPAGRMRGDIDARQGGFATRPGDEPARDLQDRVMPERWRDSSASTRPASNPGDEMRFDRPPPGDPPGFGRGGAVTQAMTALQAATSDEKTSPAQLREKVAEVRAARRKARGELAVAQNDLLRLLTPDQEAVLVGLGYID